MAILKTSRITLRPAVSHRRCRPFVRVNGEPGFHAFLARRLHARTDAWVSRKVLTWDREGLPSQFAIEIESEGTLLGYCGFFHQDVDGTSEIEIGYRLHPDYWNKGLATEAATAVRDHAFRDLKLSRVISLIHPENIASRRVAEKIGMTLEKHTTFRGLPANVFSRSREQWLKEHVA